MSAGLALVLPLAHGEGDAGLDEPRVDVGIAGALILTWSAVQTELLVRAVRRSGALQRYVRGSEK